MSCNGSDLGDHHALLREFGAEAEPWIAEMPAKIARLEREWGFVCGAALEHGGNVSWLASAQLPDGSEAILKIGYPHEESRFEADALRHFGEAAVHVYRSSEDGFALLMERCDPGTDLWQLDEREADGVACQILPKIWSTSARGTPFTHLSVAVEQWWIDLDNDIHEGNYEPCLVDSAKTTAAMLLSSQPAQVVLHGDFHPANVLAAKREPWLVIDPKPLIGDPAFDLAQWLYNRYAPAAATGAPGVHLQNQINRFARALDLDRDRIAGWAFVKALGWKCSPDVVDLFGRIAIDGSV